MVLDVEMVCGSFHLRKKETKGILFWGFGGSACGSIIKTSGLSDGTVSY